MVAALMTCFDLQDFPYSTELQGTPGPYLNALIDNAEFLSAEEKQGIFEEYAKAFVYV